MHKKYNEQQSYKQKHLVYETGQGWMTTVDWFQLTGELQLLTLYNRGEQKKNISECTKYYGGWTAIRLPSCQIVKEFWFQMVIFQALFYFPHSLSSTFI